MKARLGNSNLEDWSSYQGNFLGETTPPTFPASRPEVTRLALVSPLGLAVLFTLSALFLVAFVFGCTLLT